MEEPPHKIGSNRAKDRECGHCNARIRGKSNSIKPVHGDDRTDSSDPCHLARARQTIARSLDTNPKSRDESRADSVLQGFAITSLSQGILWGAIKM